ncbi:MAG TPA: HAD family hydrolase [Microlunatus sp.]
MTIKLVAFDLDGTILERDGSIAAACSDAIAGLQDLGVRCVTASGRSADFQLDLLTRSGLLHRFDALIGDERWVHLVAPPSDDQPLRSFEPWNTDVGKRWLDLEPEAGQHCRQLAAEAARRGWRCAVSDRTDDLARGLCSVSFDTSANALELAAWLEPQLSGDQPDDPRDLGYNCNGSMIHVFDAAYDKGTTLIAVAEHFGLAADEVMAFGDNFNDGPILDGRYQFRPATVANADPIVKGWVRDAGGSVADHGHGHGVAQLLTEAFATRPIPRS